MLEGDLLPTSADDFDRLLLQSPNSSIIWLRYMAFHLESAEIEKARAIAERALKSISFRFDICLFVSKSDSALLGIFA